MEKPTEKKRRLVPLLIVLLVFAGIAGGLKLIPLAPKYFENL